ncbi:MAG: PQQ-binding-like beta-propeller repeat protein [Gammaproteobacteria bacterium]|nr:PQQ-binding-like beta-propeller repeat protein [Gammaproteobacteria bacterium]
MRRSRSLSRTAFKAGALVGLLGATLSLHAAPEIYPPPREGIEPAVATLNVDASMLHRGAGSYRHNCSACHGADGAGGGALWSELTAKPNDLRDPAAMSRLSDMDIARVIQYGGFEMPPLPAIQREELIALAAFVRSLSYPDLQEIELHPLTGRTVDGFVPVTAAQLADPDPGDWLMYRRTWNAWGFSPLDQVTRENVSGLTLAWSRAMEPGEQETTPLVYDGTMFLAHPGDVIQALDARTGDLIWEYRGEPVTAGKTRMRNIAIYRDRIFHFTKNEPHLIALDARDGSLLWQVPVDGDFSSGPVIMGGKVVGGRSCSPSDGPDACYIAAYDPRTGAEIWRRNTIVRPEEPGGDSWGDLAWKDRRHVGAWGSGSYDPALGLIYWGTSVPAPSLERVRGTPGGDVLYSNSTLALDEETGEIAWYYQHLPRDNWDMDHVFERLLVDTRVRPDPSAVQWINPALDKGEAHKVVTGIPGKTGIVYTLNRETGEFLWATPTLNQNLVTQIDTATGEVHIDENLVVDAFEEILVCPGRAGGKNWPSGAYNPNTGLMYQPQQNLCMLHTGNAASPTPEEVYASSVVFVEDPTIDQTPYPVGRVDAVSIESGRVAWTHQQRAGMLSGLVATAGGLVFGGDANRRFKAFDDLSGQVLWETILSGPVTGHPISYQADGRQYIAVPVGGGTAEPERRVLSIHPEMKPSRGINAIFVFALPSDG